MSIVCLTPPVQADRAASSFSSIFFLVLQRYVTVRAVLVTSPSEHWSLHIYSHLSRLRPVDLVHPHINPHFPFDSGRFGMKFAPSP